MRTFHDDRSGDDEEPVYPHNVDRGHDTPTADEPVYPEPNEPVLYRDPTQPVEPMYPTHQDETVTPEVENVDSGEDESFLDKVKRWFKEAPEEIKKDLDDR